MSQAEAGTLEETVGNYGTEPVAGVQRAYRGLTEVSVTAEGTTPLLMNAMSMKTLLDIWTKKKKPKNAANREPREEAASKLHLLPDGRPYLPRKCLYAALINAGRFVRLEGKKQVSTATSTVLPAMIMLPRVGLPLYIPGTDKSAVWEVDIQQGKGSNGGAVVIIRPRFDLWEFRFTMFVDQNELSIQSARELIDKAGIRVGLLDFAPRSKGEFGCFVVTSWKVTQPEKES